MERGRLAQAYSCLMHAHHLAPSEDYILRHLQIIQTRLGKLKTQLTPSKEKERAFSDYDPSEYGGAPMIVQHVVSKRHSKEFKRIHRTISDPVFVESMINDPYSDTDEYIQQQVIQQQQQQHSNQNGYQNYVTDMDDPSSGMS